MAAEGLKLASLLNGVSKQVHIALVIARDAQRAPVVHRHRVDLGPVSDFGPVFPCEDAVHMPPELGALRVPLDVAEGLCACVLFGSL